MNVPARNNIAAGGGVAAIIPQNLDDAYRLSTALAASGMAPRGMDRPEQILVAIMAGAELGLAPFQSLQSFAVVNGRPTLWGDGLLAVVRGRGVRVREWAEGEGDQMVAHCVATRPDNGEEIARSFAVADAKKAGLWNKQGPWQQYPRRMLQMRARALALRDGCADMLRGIQVREEVEDYQHIRDVTPPAPTGIKERLEAARAEGRAGEGFTAHNGAEAAADDLGANFEPIDEALAPQPADPDPVTRVEAEPEPMTNATDPVEATPEPAPARPANETQDFTGQRPAFTIEDWAARLEDDLPLYETVDDLRSAWDLRKGELKASSIEAHRHLNMLVARRAEEIGASR